MTTFATSVVSLVAGKLQDERCAGERADPDGPRVRRRDRRGPRLAEPRRRDLDAAGQLRRVGTRVLEGEILNNCRPSRAKTPAALRTAAGSNRKPRNALPPVEATGLEPVTYDLQSRCSTN